MKKAFQYCLVFFFALSISLIPRKVYAQSDPSTPIVHCAAGDRVWYDFDIEFPDLTIEKFLSELPPTLLLSTVPYMIYGKNGDILTWCAAHQMLQNGDLAALVDSESCAMTAEEWQTNCADMGDEGEMVTEFMKDPKKINVGLVAFTQVLSSAVRDSKNPANLAFFANKKLSGLPFMGKALAQSTNNYRFQAILDPVYQVWSISKNLALGAMAVIILVVGMMIITRKQISPQAAVTIQTALPRIAIAMVLIVLSYPIGAAFSSLAWGLRGAESELVSSGFTNQAGLATFFKTMMAIGLGGPIGTLAFVAFILITTLVWLVAFILALFKAIGVYIQMLVLIISGPVSLALGAVPTFERQTIKWFKSLFSKALAIPLMFGVLDLSLAIAWRVFISLLGANASPEFTLLGTAGFLFWNLLGGSVVSAIIASLIMINGALLARTVPDKLDEFIMGEDAPKKKR